MISPSAHPKQTKFRQHFLAPEVVQTSAMDCGPASLKCLLEGFNIPVSYGRLREACQTDVDGTSIDALEEILVQIGLEAEQIMLPVDHILLSESQTMPAVVVVRLPNGFTHFVVTWRRLGSVIQMMDPATGRRWVTLQRFLDELYIHTHQVPASAWREWVGSDEFLGAFRHRLADLGLTKPEREEIIKNALFDASWYSMACLDASTRMVAALIRSGGLYRGHHATNVLKVIYKRAQTEIPASISIPSAYWSVLPGPPATDAGEQLLMRGALLVRVKPPTVSLPRGSETQTEETVSKLPPELEAALEEKQVKPWREVWHYLRTDGLLTPMILVAAIFFAAIGTIIEALFFRGLLGILTPLGGSTQRLELTLALLILVGGLLLLENSIAVNTLRLGRRLESRLRLGFLEKIPRLTHQYFRSRPMSDMADRSHNAHHLRQLPDLGRQFLQKILEIVLTTAGMIWIHPVMAPVIVLAAILSLAIPLLFYPLIVERDLRFRTHTGALSVFFLDVLLGLVPVRAHGAENSVQSEYEGLLVEWARAKFRVFTLAIGRDGVQLFLALSCVAWTMIHYFIFVHSPGGALLLAYWGLALPLRGREVLHIVEDYVSKRNISLRLLEPLGAPEEIHVSKLSSVDENSASNKAVSDSPSKGASIAMKKVCVRAAGHIILEDIDFNVEAGSHVAIVGPSGAGKSSLMGLLLGWQRSMLGEVLIDNSPLDGPGLRQLRRQTAWVDSGIQLWNRSLLDNIRYGAMDKGVQPIAQIIEQADLLNMLRNLPDGLQTSLGEGGCLISGGEGQRVRLARAMFRPNIRLVILDEPFRGLDYVQRQELLKQVRQLWKEATLLCITHDIAATLAFERVLVLENGRITEHGNPVELASNPGSRYKGMLEAEQWVREHGWFGPGWRSMQMEAGWLVDSNQINVPSVKENLEISSPQIHLKPGEVISIASQKNT